MARPPSSPAPKDFRGGRLRWKGGGLGGSQEPSLQAEWGHRQRAEQAGGAVAASRSLSLLFSDQGQAVPGQAHLGPGPLPVAASSEALEGSGGVLLARRQCQLLRGLWSAAGLPRGLAGPAGSLGSWRLRGSLPLRRLQRAPCWAGLGPWWNHRPRSGGGCWWAPPAGRSQSPQEARGAERGLPARVEKLHLPRGLRRLIRPPGSP